MTAVLVQGGAKLDGKVKPSKKGPSAVTAEIAADADLAKLAAAVNSCNTPHKKKVPPGVALVLYCELNDDTSAAALNALGKLDGIAKDASADAKTQMISVKLSGEGKVTLADIHKALDGAGVKASLTK